MVNRTEKILGVLSFLILIFAIIFIVVRCCRKIEVAVQPTGNVDITAGPIVYDGPGATDEKVTDNSVTIYRGTLETMYRVEDAEAGVVCWIYSGFEKGGVSCLPIEQTRLGR